MFEGAYDMKFDRTTLNNVGGDQYRINDKRTFNGSYVQNDNRRWERNDNRHQNNTTNNITNNNHGRPASSHQGDDTGWNSPSELRRRNPLLYPGDSGSPPYPLGYKRDVLGQAFLEASRSQTPDELGREFFSRTRDWVYPGAQAPAPYAQRGNYPSETVPNNHVYEHGQGFSHLPGQFQQGMIHQAPSDSLPFLQDQQYPDTQCHDWTNTSSSQFAHPNATLIPSRLDSDVTQSDAVVSADIEHSEPPVEENLIGSLDKSVVSSGSAISSPGDLTGSNHGQGQPFIPALATLSLLMVNTQIPLELVFLKGSSYSDLFHTQERKGGDDVSMMTAPFFMILNYDPQP
ncbi:hypothetical protein D9758_007673 [Tetrapyrgos nigripes]|uniref:Uncharacterized protein n=1 Tax=Tetrapyrgos nigripes TaxID=182062 RepID=A0A8H5G5C1_9AGAR|nr:hypothetical protein D9758_007673 [Tetrapyrgos nigripes]